MDDRRDIARRRGYDRGLMLSVLFLVGAGIVMVYSASFRYAESCRLPSGYFFFRQAGYALVGLVALLVASRLDYHVWGWKKVPKSGSMRISPASRPGIRRCGRKPKENDFIRAFLARMP